MWRFPTWGPPKWGSVEELGVDTRGKGVLASERISDTTRHDHRRPCDPDRRTAATLKHVHGPFGARNSHEVFLHRNPGARPRTVPSILPESDGNETHPEGRDEPRRRVGRIAQPGFASAAGAQLVSRREQVLCT